MSPPVQDDAAGPGFVDRLAGWLDREAQDAGSADPAAGPPPGPVPGDFALGPAVARVLREESTWREPPADLRLAVLAAATGQLPARAAPAPAPHLDAAQPAVSHLDAVPPLPSRPGPTPGRRPDRHAARPADPGDGRSALLRRLRWTVPLAAVAAAILTFSVLAAERALQPSPQGTSYAAAGTTLAPRADATITVASAAAGFSVVIAVHDLPAAAPGSYYAAWLRGPLGVVPIGSFHGRRTGDPIKMWSGVDPAAYPTFTVTLQREGGPVEPSDQVVLTATLAR